MKEIKNNFENINILHYRFKAKTVDKLEDESWFEF